MLIKKLGCSLIILLLCLTISSSVEALSFSSLSFHGVGLDIELIFPEEAHPEDNIDHNVTITSQINPEINVFNLTIYGTINQTLQEIKNLFLSLDLDDPYIKRINVSLPKETRGKLFCTLYVKTDQDADYYFTSFYTTHVNPITFSELLTEFSLLLSEYETIKTLYTAKISELDSLSTEYSNLEISYQLKINEFNDLLENYNSLNLTSNDLQGNLTSLQDDYDTLNQELSVLQEQNALLDQDIMNAQNNLDVDRVIMTLFIIILVSLIGLIVYLRNKQKEPYVVIRKETVSMKPEKK